MDWVLTKPLIKSTLRSSAEKKEFPQGRTTEELRVPREESEKASCFNGKHVHCVGDQGPPHPTWGTRKCLFTMCGVPPEKLSNADGVVISAELFDTYEESNRCEVCAFKRAKAKGAPR